MRGCPACGHENADGARFCSACGAPLAAASGREVRKVVTVVFCDVVGSTALGERLDPEAVRGVMSRYFDAMQETLERYGGTVEKFIGDAVMAAFGVPTVHEDDALRAVRAAAAMRDELALLNNELEHRHGVRIEIRTGVNTGEVVAGDAEARQRLVTGDAVNVAARLEQAAGRGEILLGDDTYRLVRDAVRTEALDPLEAKGKSGPLAAWRLVEVLGDVPAFTRPIATAFVGRAQELAALEQAFEAAKHDRSCVLVTIVGGPGIGKSRLARELIGAVSDSARVLVGRCLPYGEGITYWPLAEVVHQLAGKEPERRLAELVDDEHSDVIAARIGAAVGVGETPGSPEETAWAFRKLLEALAREKPLLLVIDDIHWAEPTLLDLLEYLVAFSTGVPILVLCLARPDLFDSRPTWAAPRAQATLVSLTPLSSEESDSLIARLLRQRELGERARARIAEAAEGNPLFIEQILAMQAERPDDEVVVPPTIQALLAARIDRLEPAERAVLERASVEGRLFHRGAVQELLPAPFGAGIGAHLMSLIRKEFIRPDQALFLGDDGFRFNHILIRDAAYDSLPKQLRADSHECYADWLERRTDSSVGELEEIIGYHLEQAYRYHSELGRVDERAETAARRGGHLLASAGRRASARADPRAAARLLERAADLLAVDDRARADILPDYGEAVAEAGELDTAERVLDEAVQLAQKLGDRRSELRAEVRRAWARFNRGVEGWADDALRIADRAIEVFAEVGDDGEVADALILRGWAEGTSGRQDERVATLLRAREHARKAGDERREMVIWVVLGGAMLSARTPADELLTFGAEEVAWAQGKRIPFIEGDGILVGAYVYPRLGRFEEGRDALRRTRAIYAEVGMAENYAETFRAGAQLEMLAGDPAAAERELREALGLYAEMGDKWWSAELKPRLAEAVHAQRRREEALDLLEAAEAEGVPGNYRYEVAWRTARAKLLAADGQATAASQLAHEAADILASTGNIAMHADALVALADVLAADAQDADAAAALERAAALYDEKEYTWCADQARSRRKALAARR